MGKSEDRRQRSEGRRQKICLLSSVFCFLFSVVCLLIACGARQPTPARAQRVIQHHFHQYGKKYKESPFGKAKVRDVEILETEEIHKHLVAVTSFVTLENNEVFKVRVTIEKGSFGWRYVSWERLL